FVLFLPAAVAHLAALSFPTRRSSDLAARLLGAVGDEKALAQLIRSSLVDEHSDVRSAARDGALASHHPDLVSPYLKALATGDERSEEHTSELQSLTNLVCRLLLQKTK